MKVLRVEEELMIFAVARTQNGSMVDDVKFDWEVTEGVDPIDDDPSDDTMTNTVTAEEAGTAMLRVTAMGHAISADIDIEVTAKAGKVTLMAMGAEDAFEADDSYFPGDVVAAMLQAIPDVKHRAGSNVAWSSSDGDVAKVDTAAGALKDDNPNKRYAKVTAEAAGTATITAMYEGKKASFDVVVSGSRSDRTLTYYFDDDTFSYVIGATDAAWMPATLPLEIAYEDGDGDPLASKRVKIAVDGSNLNVAVATADGAAGTPATDTGNSSADAVVKEITVPTGMDGTISLVVTPILDGPTAVPDSAPSTVITLSAQGADNVNIRVDFSISKIQ